MEDINQILLGAIAMASLVASLFFLRFWKDTRDRFFLLFAASFLIEAFNRILFWQGPEPTLRLEAYYVFRLIEYSLILLAILDKNRPRKKGD